MVARSAEADRLQSVGIRRLTPDDLKRSIREGFEDVKRTRSDALFLVVIWPVLGVLLVALSAGRGLLELVFPLVAGFAILGPLAAVGLYESSRQAETGRRPALLAAYREATGRAGGRMLKMAALLFALFFGWLMAARGLWGAVMGVEAPETVGSLLAMTLTTGPGWALILVGHAVGAVFAATAMAISVFSLPMLLDGERSVTVAVTASVRACLVNARMMLAWGLVVSVALALGSVPALAGLIVVLPVFGHATWRLYRRTIER